MSTNLSSTDYFLPLKSIANSVINLLPKRIFMIQIYGIYEGYRQQNKAITIWTANIIHIAVLVY